MFKNEFQGGAYVEVFSAQGKDPTAHWKLSGASGIKKEFDKTVKGFVYILDGALATTKMQLPKDLRQSLCLTQRYLLLQLHVAKGREFSVDVGIQDMSGSKRHLFFSTAHRETHTTPLHTKVPLGLLRRDVWLNLCLDLTALVGETWRGQSYKSIESLCISASCRLRRVFTMRLQPPDTTNDEELYGFTGTNTAELDSIPRQCQLAPDVPQEVQVLNMMKICHFEGRVNPQELGHIRQSSDPGDLDLSLARKSTNLDSFHIAFGTKVSGGQRRGSGKESASGPKSSRTPGKSRPDSGSDAGTRNNSKERPNSGKLELPPTPRERKNSDPGTNQTDPELSIDKTSLKTSHTWTDGADGKEDIPFVHPHPPRGPSSDRARRKPRVKSAGKERTPHVLGNIDDGKGYSQSTGSASVSGQSSRASSGNVERTPHIPQVVANDDEMEAIMRQMQESARRDCKMSESSSESSSHKNSAVSDDSISEVIGMLKEGSVMPPYRPGEYEESEGDDEEDVLYTFSSPPKSAPRLMAHPEGAKAKKNLYKSQKHRARRRPSGDNKDSVSHNMELRSHDNRTFKNGTHGTRNVTNLSSEEETMLAKLNKPNTHSRPGESRRTKAKNLSTHKSRNGLMNIPSPVVLNSPGGSQPRMCISRKSLREIPQDDVRLSNTQKQYDVAKYQMEDLTDSFEQQMLMSLRRQTMEEGCEQEEEADKADMQRLHYGQDSLSDSSEDSSMGTFKGQAHKLKSHNYQDEMKMASARLNNEFLSQSNPRDWGKVFSPPIVLPSTVQTQDGQMDTLGPSAPEVMPKTDTKAASRSGQSADSDEEGELDLLYDPVLNCYFDPKTCRYYELV